jgi:hypothetical protein
MLPTRRLSVVGVVRVGYVDEWDGVPGVIEGVA